MRRLTGEKICGKYYKAYLDGETIAPVTKPFYYGWPGSVEIAVLKDNEVLPIGWISGLSDEIKEDFATNRNLYINKDREKNLYLFYYLSFSIIHLSSLTYHLLL